MTRYRDSIPNTSWKNVSEPVSSEGGFKGSPDSGRGFDWGKAGSAGADFLKGWLDKDREKYRDEAKFGGDRPYFGEGFKGTGGQVLENLGVVYPQQSGPAYLPGQQGSPGFLGGGGGKALAGIAGLALAPMTGGASLAFSPMVGQAAESAGRTWNI